MSLPWASKSGNIGQTNHQERVKEINNQNLRNTSKIFMTNKSYTCNAVPVVWKMVPRKWPSPKKTPGNKKTSTPKKSPVVKTLTTESPAAPKMTSMTCHLASDTSIEDREPVKGMELLQVTISSFPFLWGRNGSSGSSFFVWLK